ncbi:hypothetical protein ACF0H5_023847 [Mactra antiquata]
MMCSTGIELHPHSYSNICAPCSCYGGCTEETYCPVVSFEDAKCVHQASFLNKTEMVPNLHPFLQRMYYVIATCPPNTLSEERDQCESIQTLNNSHYVSGISSFKIYKNEICARCNGEQRFVKWKYTGILTQEDMIALENGTKSDAELLSEIKKRDVLSTPPDDYPEDLNVCSPDDINKCNATGWWKSYDQNLVQLCNYPLHARIETYRRIFKNVYCAACNLIDDVVCLPYVSKYSTGHGALSGLLSWTDEETSASETKREHRCSDKQMIDPLEDVCRPIVCPMGQFAIYEECKKRSVSLWNMALAVQLKAFFHNETVYASFDEGKFKDKISSDCRLCGSTCIKVNNELGIVVYCILWIKTTILCPLDYLVDFLNPSNNNFRLNVRIDSGKVRVYFVIDFTTLGMSSSSRENKCETSSMVYLKPKFYCPAIVPSNVSIQKITENGLLDEFNVLSDEKLDDGINQLSSLHQNTSRIICISDYLDIASRISDGISVHL